MTPYGFAIGRGACAPAQAWLRDRQGKSPAELLAECQNGGWLMWAAVELGVDMGLQMRVARAAVKRARKVVDEAADSAVASASVSLLRAQEELWWAAAWSAEQPPNGRERAIDDAAESAYSAVSAVFAAAVATGRDGEIDHAAELARIARDARRIMGAAMLARCAELGVAP